MYSFNHLFPKILFVYNLYGTCWKYCFTALNEYQSILELILAKFFQSFIRDLDGVKDHNNTKNRENKQKRLSYCKTCWVFFVKKWPKKENWLHGNFFFSILRIRLHNPDWLWWPIRTQDSFISPTHGASHVWTLFTMF